MKYALIPKIKFKRGTSAKKRRMLTKLHWHVWHRQGEGIRLATEKVARDYILHGTTALKVVWENDDISVRHVPYGEITK